MLEAAELGQTLDHQDFAKLEPGLRTQLVQMQVKLRDAGFPVLVVVSGDDPSAVRGVLNLLSDWMDPRFVATQVFGEATQEQRHRPGAWRYWTALPPAGRIAVYADEWVTHLLAERLRGHISSADVDRNCEAIRRFEKMLADAGAVILKLYLHAATDRLYEKRKRIKRDADAHDVALIAQQMLDREDRTRRIVEGVLEQTSTDLCPWTLVESTCREYCNVTVARILLDTVIRKLAEKPVKVAKAAPIPKVKPFKSVLDKVDLSQKLAEEKYVQQMEALRGRLQKLTIRAHEKGIATVAAFEGWDAAGKGGAIRRLAHVMNPENYTIVPVAAPTDEEKAHHYLWRFWRNIPRDGQFVIFDRTWYGRVLVERVEGFCTEPEWRRAYDEINYFEQRLCSHGIILVKFWLHIDKNEQLRRFKDREKTPFKQFKIGPEDYRNREKWDQYAPAINEMIARTSTPHAPWNIIPSNDKAFARVKILETVADAIEQAL